MTNEGAYNRGLLLELDESQEEGHGVMIDVKSGQLLLLEHEDDRINQLVIPEKMS